MAYTSLGTFAWNTLPAISATVFADVSRSGANVTISAKVSLSTVTGANYYGYNILADYYIGSTKVASGVQVKASSPSQWAGKLEKVVGSGTISNSGTSQAIKVRLYSSNGGAADKTQSYTATLPGAVSVLGKISNFTFGTAFTIPITKHASSFTDSLTVKLGSKTIKTVSSITNGYSLNFTTAELDTIYKALPKATTGSVTFTLTTKSGSATVGTSAKTAIGTIPTSIKPTFSSIGISEGNSTVSALGAGYIAGYSKLKLVFNSASAGTGASISSYQVTLDGSVISTVQNGTTAVISKSGSKSLKATVTDSRGRTHSITQTVTVVAYSAPKATMSVARKSGAATTMIVSIAGSITSLSSKNSCTYTVRSKTKASSSWTTPVNGQAISGTAINISRELTSYTVSSSYDVEVTVKDKLSSTTALLALPTEKVIFDENKDGVGVMKFREKGALDVGGDINMSGNLLIDGKAWITSGSWTPIVAGANSYTEQYGRWTKTGNQVSFCFRVYCNINTVGTEPKVSGLPYKSNTKMGAGGACSGGPLKGIIPNGYQIDDNKICLCNMNTGTGKSAYVKSVATGEVMLEASGVYYTA